MAVTKSRVGSSDVEIGSPANGLAITNDVLTLSAADGSNAGALTASAQTIGGVKTFSSQPLAPGLTSNTAATLSFLSSVADGASAVAVKLAATVDFATAGAKIVSIGDNNTSSYAEKAYFALDGALSISGVASGSNAITLATGNRLKCGGGTNDYWVSDGTNLSTPSTLSAGSFRAGNLSVGAGTGQVTVINTSASAKITGHFTDGASAIGVVLDNDVTLSNATAKLLSVQNNTVEKFAIGQAGTPLLNRTQDATAQTSATANTPAGQHKISATDATFTVTNSLCTTTTQIFVTMASDPGVVTSVYATAGSGSFTVKWTLAPTNDTLFNWWITK